MINTDETELRNRIAETIEARGGSASPSFTTMYKHVEQQLLSALRLVPSGMTLSQLELAKIVEASPSRVSFLLKELRARGVVVRDEANGGHRLFDRAHVPVAKPAPVVKAPVAKKKLHRPNWPSKRELLQMLAKNSFTRTAAKLSVARKSLYRHLTSVGIVRGAKGNFVAHDPRVTPPTA